MKFKIFPLLIVFTICSTVMAATVIQSVSTPLGGASRLKFPKAVLQTSTLRVSTFAPTGQPNPLSVSGVATTWTYSSVAGGKYTQWIATGTGPFSPVNYEWRVTLTTGAKISASMVELGP